MTLPLLGTPQPAHAFARAGLRRRSAARSRPMSVGPEVLAAMALDGRNPRRRPSLRTLRLLGLLGGLAFCAAFWAGVSQALLRVIG